MVTWWCSVNHARLTLRGLDLDSTHSPRLLASVVPVLRSGGHGKVTFCCNLQWTWPWPWPWALGQGTPRVTCRTRSLPAACSVGSCIVKATCCQPPCRSNRLLRAPLWLWPDSFCVGVESCTSNKAKQPWLLHFLAPRMSGVSTPAGDMLDPRSAVWRSRLLVVACLPSRGSKMGKSTFSRVFWPQFGAIVPWNWMWLRVDIKGEQIVWPRTSKSVWILFEKSWLRFGRLACTKGDLTRTCFTT